MRFEAAKFGSRELLAQGIILAISAIVVAVWVFTKPIIFTHDSFTYIDHARDLLLGQPGAALFSRLPAYPMVLWAFGVTDLKHSVFWLTIFQSCLAVASCWLFYLTARLVEARGAFVLALVFIASLLPFLHVKYIMTEQTFFFETTLALYGLVAYLMARTNREALSSIAILGAGAALMTLTRPQGAYVVFALFGVVTILVWRRTWVALTGVVLVVGVVWLVQAVDQRVRLGSQASVGGVDSSHMTGKMLFFTFYAQGSGANVPITRKNGPRTAEFRALLLDELAKPDTLARRIGYLAAVPPDEVPAYLDRSFATFDSNFFAMVAFTALNERLGLKEADRLLLRVSLEAALAHPLETVWLLLGRGLEIYLNPWMPAVPVYIEYGPFPSGTFQSPLAEEVAAAGDYSKATSTDLAIDRNVRWLMRGAILLAIITLPIALRYPTWRITIALLVFGLYLNLAVVVGNSPLFRYAIYAIPVNLLCAYVGAVALISLLATRLRRRRLATAANVSAP
jgi:hypothetical protein